MLPQDRRQFLNRTAVVAFAGILSHQASSAALATMAQHIPARIVSGPDIMLPAGKREPFGWKTYAVEAEPLLMDWPDFPSGASATVLRLTVGMDVRDEKLIEASLRQSGRVLGTFEVRYGWLFRMFEIPLQADDLTAIRREGLGLRLTKGSKLRIFTGGEGIPAALLPYLLVPGTADRMAEYFSRMDSPAFVQSFSWQGGCVLDGLMDLSALPAHVHLRDAARRQLDRYVIDGKLVCENHVSSISGGRIYGIEGTLPFAALAQLEPQHPLLDLPLTFWGKHRGGEDAILDGQHTSSEGCYTVGYPMAVIGKIRQDEALQQLAITQLRVRQARLFDGTMFWRTSEPKDGVVQKGNRAWARGIGWQLPGFAGTLRELKHRSDLTEQIASFQQLAAWVMPFQKPDGLWSVFVDQPDLPPDNSGSAGIAAALAIGAQQGWLGTTAKSAAAKTLTGLLPHLTPGGFLGGVSQANKAGEQLQRGNYRVIYQMGMGLMAQLVAAFGGGK